MSNGMKCKCGFQFSGPGEYRNCQAFTTKDHLEGVVCPKCGQAYVNWKPVILEKEETR